VQGLPLKLLPSAAEPLIYGSIDSQDRRSLLQTSCWGRDAVLREARSIDLWLREENGSNLRPLARLLARACEATAGQLSLSLDAGSCTRGWATSNVLAQLLDAGIKKSGWTTVGELALKVSRVCALFSGVLVLHDRLINVQLLVAHCRGCSMTAYPSRWLLLPFQRCTACCSSACLLHMQTSAASQPAASSQA
jgi:hypothetical protein